MKRSLWMSGIIGPVLLISLNAWAHDPSEHMKNGEKADCSAMHDMDHSKMDMNDPVMLALMQKCMHRDDEGRLDGKEDGHQQGDHMSSREGEDEHHHMH